MSKVQMLRALVKQRLTAAAEEIFGLFEITIAEYEEELSRSKEENERQRKLLDAVFSPQLRLHRADVQKLSVVKEEVPPEQQEWSSSLDQEDPEPPHIKEEQEELWTSQEGEQLQGLEEADIIKFTFTPVPVKSEDDEEKPQSSQLHQRRAEQMETEADGEDCGRPEPARNSDPDTHLRPDTDEKTRDCSGPETDDGDDWKETREPQSSLNSSMKNDDVPVSDFRFGGGKKPFRCSNCRKGFGSKGNLKRHMRIHTGEKPFSCSVCMKSFTQRANLQTHMRIHTREEQFSSSVCNKRNSGLRSSRRHQTQTEVNRKAEPRARSSNEQMETEADGEDCGGPELARNSDPDQYLRPDTDDKTGDRSEPETDDSDDWKESRPSGTDVQQLLVVKEEVPPEQQKRSSNLDQEAPEPPHIKEEQEDLWTSQEGEQLQGLEEADITKFPLTPVPVKSEEDEEKPQSSQLHQRRIEQMETEADGEDRGGPEPIRNSDTDRHPEPDDDKTGDSSEPETDDSDDWKETREPQSGLNYLMKHNEAPVNDSRCRTGEKPFSCSECVKTFATNKHLKRHIRIHTKGKPFSCSVCKKSFRQRGDLQKHMRIHTGEKQFSCSVCNKRFAQRLQVKTHKCVGSRFSQLHQTQTEENREAEPPASSTVDQMETDCAHLQTDTDDKTEDSSEPQTDDGDDSDF